MNAQVVGLDLSMSATGVCEADGTTRTIKFPGNDIAGDRRLAHIAGSVGVSAIGADLVVIEDFVVRTQAAGIVGMVHGAVRVALMEEGVRYITVPPATLKKYATGKGNADKTAMSLALFKRTGVELADDNQVDAWWLRAAGLQLLGAPLVELPAVQVAALDKLAAERGGLRG